MKSEHRHQLETNVLSAKLARWIEGVKPFTGQILTGLVMLDVVYVGLAIWDSQSAQRERAAWDAFAFETDTSDPELKGLHRIASDEQYAGTKMQEWAYVSWADRQVLTAMGSYLYDREKTKDLLRSVEGVYEQLETSASDSQVLNRARFGLGRVYELQNKLDEAKQQYFRVSGDLQLQASERAKQLDSEAVREACQWLASAELPKRDQTGGQGASGQRPDFNAGLPSANEDSINPKSLAELLGDFSDEAPEENRYGEKEEATAEDASTGDSASADGENIAPPDTESESAAESDDVGTDDAQE